VKTTEKKKFGAARARKLVDPNTSANSSSSEKSELPPGENGGHSQARSFTTNDHTSTVKDGEPRRTLEHITLDTLNNARSQSIALSNLERCIVDLRASSHSVETGSLADSIPALYVENISDSIIVALAVAGSVLIHNASNCILILKCHQVSLSSGAVPS